MKTIGRDGTLINKTPIEMYGEEIKVLLNIYKSSVFNNLTKGVSRILVPNSYTPDQLENIVRDIIKEKKWTDSLTVTQGTTLGDRIYVDISYTPLPDETVEVGIQ